MAMRDYICCKDCGCKVIPDGDDCARNRLEATWGDPDADMWTINIVRCKPCTDKLEKDAEQYRWLRQHRVRVFVDDRDGYSCLLFDHENPELLDAAINAAREA